jgi:hypothetical protein
MHSNNLVPAFSGLLAPPPAAVIGAIGMLSAGERALLFNLARDHYRGDGIIIDAGLFLGASTLAFGAGLEANPVTPRAAERWGRPMRSFELGIVNPGMLRIFAKNGIGADLALDSSFEPLLRERLQPVAHLTELRVGDVMKTGHVDEPVEILFLDLLKLPEIATYCLREYFTKLVPGAFVIQQDYFIESLPFIKTMQETFAAYFEFIGAVGASGVFRLVQPIPAEAIAAYSDPGPAPEDHVRCAEVALTRAASRPRAFLMELSRLDAMRVAGYDRDARAAEWARIGRDYAEFLAPEQPMRIRGAIRHAERMIEGKHLTREELAAEGMADLEARRARLAETEASRARRALEQAERTRAREARAAELAAAAAERERQHAERTRAREARAAEVAAAAAERERVKAERARAKEARAAEVATAAAARAERRAARAAAVAANAARRERSE